MNRLPVLVAFVLAAGIGFAIAGHPREDGENVRVLSMLDIQEKLTGIKQKRQWWRYHWSGRERSGAPSPGSRIRRCA